MQITKTIIAILPVILCWSSALMAANYYVAPNGKEGSEGTMANPWSLIYANAQLRPGDTAILRGGVYKDQQIAPSRSGADENQRIVYAAYLGETPDFRASSHMASPINIETRSYITIDGISADGEGIYRDSKYDYWVFFNNTSHCILKNSNLVRSKGYEALLFKNGSNHNQVLNNSLDYNGTWDSYKWKGTHDDSGSMFWIRAGNNYNLIQGNSFRRSGHDLGLIEGDFNIIRMNVFDNIWGIYEGSAFKHKSGDIQSGDIVGNRTISIKAGNRNLIEENVFKNVPESVDDKIVGMIKADGSHQIVRRNYFFNGTGGAITSSVGSSNPKVNDIKIYNNTIYDIGGTAWRVNSYYTDYPPPTDNIFKNNIIYKSHQDPDVSNNDAEVRYTGLEKNFNDPFLGNIFTHNCVAYNESASKQIINTEALGKESLDTYESKHPQFFNNNVQAAPMFVSDSPKNPADFALQSNSPCIDAGDELTKTTSGGTGKIIKVEDADYFVDGYGLIAGDLIRVGSAVVRINDIDYAKNTITVDKSISWAAGDHVNLSYKGRAPDMGAREFGDLPTSPPAAPTITDVK